MGLLDSLRKTKKFTSKILNPFGSATDAMNQRQQNKSYDDFMGMDYGSIPQMGSRRWESPVGSAPPPPNPPTPVNPAPAPGSLRQAASTAGGSTVPPPPPVASGFGGQEGNYFNGYFNAMNALFPVGMSDGIKKPYEMQQEAVN